MPRQMNWRCLQKSSSAATDVDDVDSAAEGEGDVDNQRLRNCEADAAAAAATALSAVCVEHEVPPVRAAAAANNCEAARRMT